MTLTNAPAHCGARGIRSRRVGKRQLGLIILLVVVLTRVIVPPGYMPTPIHSGASVSLFTLCGGDARSSQLMNAWHHTEHGGHSAEGHSASVGFELCAFDALSFVFASLTAVWLSPVIAIAGKINVRVIRATESRPVASGHPPRAPPWRSTSRSHPI